MGRQGKRRTIARAPITARATHGSAASCEVRSARADDFSCCSGGRRSGAAAPSSDPGRSQVEWDAMTEREPNHAKLAELFHGVLGELGEDPERQGLQKTPQRVAKSLDFLTSGYRKDPAKILNGAVFDE